LADRAKSWKNVVAEESVSASRAHIYERVMEAEERIARALYKRGESDANVQAALDAVDERLTEAERREDLYLSSLGHYLEALGGQLEVRAVFGDEAITLRRHPKS
jgi:regulator of sigma D